MQTTVANPLDIYLLGICGTGVGALAGLLKSQGHRVRGSDENVYPPMSDKLREWGIPILEGYQAAHLDRAPDLVIVGNVIRAQNPEATAARERGLRVMSMPQAVAEFGIGERHSIVVAGTHGKTTTSALCAHVLMTAGVDPSFLVGGALRDYPESFRAGAGPHFVVEGDEYDTAYFDKGPKFWHYRPRTAIITSIEFDHADIFADIAAVERAFAGLVERVPQDGHLVLWQGATRALRLARELGKGQRVTVYGTEADPPADLTCRSFSTGPDGLTFAPVYRGETLGELRLGLWGTFSVHNALAVLAALLPLGISYEAIRRGFASFSGVKRRMELCGEPRGIAVVDDFAHHPTAVRETLAGARARFPNRRLWAVFEPRSATNRRNVHHAEFVAAFKLADRVVVASHERLNEIPADVRFDPHRLAADLSAQGTPAWAIESPEAIVRHVASLAGRGDVVLVMSNGGFGGIIAKLKAALAEPGAREGST